MRILKGIEKIVRLFSNVGLAMAILAILLMTILVVVEILGRGLLNVSTQLADEYSGYFLVALSYFGLGYTFRTGGFLRIQILSKVMRPKWIVKIDAISYMFAFVYTLIFAKYIFGLVYESYIYNSKAPTFAETPYYIPQFMMGVGAVILLMEIAVGFIDHIKHSGYTEMKKIGDNSDGMAS